LRLYVFHMEGIMDIKDLYSIYLKSRLVSTDTRKIQPGSLFFALKGKNFNGNNFVFEALEKGAELAVVDDEIINKEHPRIIRVDDTLGVLQHLAEYHRLKSRLKILAITGSNGKTTTKELCRIILSKKYKVYATEGNLNNHIGVPLTLLSMDNSCELGIVEMGANHPGEIGVLCEIAHPDFGLITNIGKAHLEGFGGIREVADAKGELFKYLIKNNRTIFLNKGDRYVQQLVPDNYGNVIGYNNKRGLHVQHGKNNPFYEFDVVGNNFTVHLKTNLLGRYNAENILAAFCVGLNMGIPVEVMIDAIQSYQPENNRSQLIKTGRNRIYMDAYNANPSSMRIVIEEFLSFKETKKILILGEMREVGDRSPGEHEDMISYLLEHDVEKVICIGKSFEKPVQNTKYVYYETVDQLMENLFRNPITGCFILIKGSRSNQLERILPLL
jgi:UDP-N-acetylmuramoyl-tripeptide--D-alanyl-D-alanine ligase